MQWSRLYQWSLRFLVFFLSGLTLWKLAGAVLPWLLPFFIALLLACLLDSPVCFLTRWLHLPRWAASALCIILAALLILSISFLILQRACYELSVFFSQLPSFIANLPVSDGRLERWLYRITVAAPVQYQQFIAQLPEQLAEGLSALPSILSQYSLSLGTAIVKALPIVLLFSFTTILATYFLLASLPSLRTISHTYLPSSWLTFFSKAKSWSQDVLAGWLKAQFLLLSVTFACLTLGLLLLGIRPPFLLAALIALVDALPILGSGTVLVPWAIFCIIGNDLKSGIGLLILYGIIALLRSMLEPKLLGKQIGLPPLIALAAMYIGFSAAGILGLLLAPPLGLLLFDLFRRRFDSHK